MNALSRFKKLISSTLMLHTREAEMFVTKKKVVYHLPWSFQSEQKMQIELVYKDATGIWIECSLPPKKIKQMMGRDEEEL